MSSACPMWILQSGCKNGFRGYSRDCFKIGGITRALSMTAGHFVEPVAGKMSCKPPWYAKAMLDV